MTKRRRTTGRSSRSRRRSSRSKRTRRTRSFPLNEKFSGLSSLRGLVPNYGDLFN